MATLSHHKGLDDDDARGRCSHKTIFILIHILLYALSLWRASHDHNAPHFRGFTTESTSMNSIFRILIERCNCYRFSRNENDENKYRVNELKKEFSDFRQAALPYGVWHLVAGIEHSTDSHC